MATLERKERIVGIGQGATFGLLATVDDGLLPTVAAWLPTRPGESSSALVSIVSSARRAAT
jgi:hypothetical protein